MCIRDSRHVADPDDRSHPDPGQVLLGGVGVAGIPGDELARRAAAGKVLTRDPELGVLTGARGIHDGVVGGEQVGARDVPPKLCLLYTSRCV